MGSAIFSPGTLHSSFHQLPMTPQRRRAMLSKLVDTSSSGNTIMISSTTESLFYVSSPCSLASQTISRVWKFARNSLDRLPAEV